MEMNLMNVFIRKATIDDFEPIQRLNLQIEEAEISFDSNLLEDCMLKQKGIKLLKKSLKDKKITHFVAIIDNEIVGCIEGEVLDAWYYKEKVGFLSHLCVDKKYRRRGIGTKLLERFTNEMKLQGAKFIKLNAFPKNTAAINFYKKYNFLEYSVYYQKELK